LDFFFFFQKWWLWSADWACATNILLACFTDFLRTLSRFSYMLSTAECEIIRWLDGRGRVSNIFRYLWDHKFQKTELIVAHSLECWAIQSMVDSIKGLASTVSSRRWCPLKGLQVWCPEPCTAQSAKYAGTWLFIEIL
jgi:hypothetical protein